MALSRKAVSVGVGALAAAGGLTYGVAEMTDEPELTRLEIVGTRNSMNPGSTTAWSVRTLDGGRVVRPFEWRSDNEEVVRPVTRTSGLLIAFEAGRAGIHVRAIVDGDTLCAMREFKVNPFESPVVDTVAPLDMTVNYRCSPQIDSVPGVVSPVDSIPQYPCARLFYGTNLDKRGDTAFFVTQGLVPDAEKPYCLPYNTIIFEEGEFENDSGPLAVPGDSIFTRVTPPISRQGLPGYRGQ